MILIAHENVELFSCAWIVFADILYLPSVAVLNSQRNLGLLACDKRYFIERLTYNMLCLNAFVG